MHDKLAPGLKGTAAFNVTEEFLASHVGSGLVESFSTAMMIGGMEQAAVNAVQARLPAGQTTVGVHVNVSHVAATPQGMGTRYEAELKEISSNAKALVFYVKAFDEKELIGEGEHKRVVVDKEKFEGKAKQKLK